MASDVEHDIGEPPEEETPAGGEDEMPGGLHGFAAAMFSDQVEIFKVGVLVRCCADGLTLLPKDVLFVMHGVLRNAREYCLNWRKLAERFNLLIICPEFSDSKFPGNDYNFGAVDNSRRAPRSTWAFSSIEQIFNVLLMAGLKRNGYHLFGHSAGSQFCHRMVLWMPPRCRLLRAVSANAGWYTLPRLDSDFNYPYSLKQAPVKVDEEQLRLAFSRKLVIMLGQEDTGSK